MGISARDVLCAGVQPRVPEHRVMPVPALPCSLQQLCLTLKVQVCSPALRPPPLCLLTEEVSLAPVDRHTLCLAALDFCPFQLTRCLFLPTFSVRSPSLSWSVFRGTHWVFWDLLFLLLSLRAHIVDPLGTLQIIVFMVFRRAPTSQPFLPPEPCLVFPLFLFYSGRFFCTFSHGLYYSVPVTVFQFRWFGRSLNLPDILGYLAKQILASTRFVPYYLWLGPVHPCPCGQVYRLLAVLSEL